MKDIDAAMAIVQCMKENVRHISVCVKCRIGIDDFDSLEFLVDIIAQLAKVCIAGLFFMPASVY
jgi:tRNA-dihydrouridine synthase